MIYLLDTNACVEYLRQRNSPLIQRIAAHPAGDLRVCSVVKAELYYGAQRSQHSQSNWAKVDTFVQQFLSLPFNDTAAEHYARIRTDLESRGMVIGPYDLQIGAIALGNSVTLVTNNTSEFGESQAWSWRTGRRRLD